MFGLVTVPRFHVWAAGAAHATTSSTTVLVFPYFTTVRTNVGSFPCPLPLRGEAAVGSRCVIGVSKQYNKYVLLVSIRSRWRYADNQYYAGMTDG